MTKQRALHAFGFLLAIFLIGLADHLQHSTWVLAPAIGAIVTALLVDLRKVFGSDLPGPPAVVALLVALALSSCSGCWLTKPPPVTPTAPDGGFADASSGQTFVDCSEAALHAGALGILPAVETALALGDYEVELAKLVGAVGLAEVECAVSWAVAMAEQQRAQTADSLEATKVGHGRAWQAKNPVTFK